MGLLSLIDYDGRTIVIWWFTEDDLQEWLAQGAFGVRGELGLGTAALRGEAARLNAPWLHPASPAGIVLSTPESTHLAPSDNLELSAEKDVKVTSTEQSIDLSATKEILLACGGAYVRIKDGNIEIHAPGKIDVKGAQHLFGGPTSLDAVMPELPEGECEKQFASADQVSAGAMPLKG